MNQGSTPRLLEGCSGDWFIPYIFSLKNVLWCKTRSDTLSKMIQGCTIAYNTLKGQLETKQESTCVYPRTNGLTIASCDSKNINNSWQWLVISKERVQKLNWLISRNFPRRGTPPPPPFAENNWYFADILNVEMGGGGSRAQTNRGYKKRNRNRNNLYFIFVSYKRNRIYPKQYSYSF